MTESSRICVKNIGKTAKDVEMRNLFSKCGEITDLKIMRRPDGTSRNFAFIGYRTPDQAQSAVKYFNNTFVGLSRLSVSIALRVGELDEKAKLRRDKRTASQPIAVPAPTNKATKPPAATNITAKPVVDSKPISKKKEKFLELALGKGKELVSAASGAEAPRTEMDVDDPSDNESINDFVQVSAKDAKSLNKRAANKDNSDNDINNDYDEDADNDEDDGFVELSALKPVSDLDYLRSKIVHKNGQEVEKITMRTDTRLDARSDSDSDSSGHDNSDNDDRNSNSERDSDEDSALDLADLLRDPKAAQKQQQKLKQKALQTPVITNNTTNTTNNNTIAHEEAQPASSSSSIDPSGSSNNNHKSAAATSAEPNARLYVTNLPYNTTEEELRVHFLQTLGLYHPNHHDNDHTEENVVLEVHLPLGKEDKRGRGFGFVRLSSLAAAETAKQALTGTSFQGRVLHVHYAADQNSVSSAANMVYQEGGKGGEEGLGWSVFQKKKEEERRKLLASATNADRSSWNASYVRSDAVVDVLAQRYGASAGDLLDVSGQQGGDVAVRMALAETQVVLDNAAFLALHNITLENNNNSTNSNANSNTNSNSSSNSSSKRSDHVLLVKNLPSDASQDELEAMFTRYGALASFALAPSRTLAIADFLEPTEARAAYKGLAYRRYRAVPIYLEWATLLSGHNTNSNTAHSSEKNSSSSNKNSNNSSSNTTNNKPETAAVAAAVAAQDEDRTATCSIFVKNLNFTTDENALKTHVLRLLPFSLQHSQSLRNVSIQRKQKRADGPYLSLGYGFLEFRDRAAALEALSRIHGSVLDEHSLEAQLSSKRLSVTPNNSSNSNTNSNKRPKTKLLVKNVAFQATKKEIHDLFAAHGVVASVRLPKTMAAAGSGGGLRHRGFAFVDFATTQEAHNAKMALSHAHLYGRHLVIDFEDDTNAGSNNEDTNNTILGDNSHSNTNNYAQEQLAGRKRAQRDVQLLAKVHSAQSKRRKGGSDAMAEDAAENKNMRSLL